MYYLQKNDSKTNPELLPGNEGSQERRQCHKVLTETAARLGYSAQWKSPIQVKRKKDKIFKLTFHSIRYLNGQ